MNSFLKLNSTISADIIIKTLDLNQFQHLSILRFTPDIDFISSNNNVIYYSEPIPTIDNYNIIMKIYQLVINTIKHDINGNQIQTGKLYEDEYSGSLKHLRQIISYHEIDTKSIISIKEMKLIYHLDDFNIEQIEEILYKLAYMSDDISESHESIYISDQFLKRITQEIIDRKQYKEKRIQSYDKILEKDPKQSIDILLNILEHKYQEELKQKIIEQQKELEIKLSNIKINHDNLKKLNQKNKSNLILLHEKSQI